MTAQCLDCGTTKTPLLNVAPLDRPGTYEVRCPGCWIAYGRALARARRAAGSGDVPASVAWRTPYDAANTPGRHR